MGFWILVWNFQAVLCACSGSKARAATARKTEVGVAIECERITLAIDNINSVQRNAGRVIPQIGNVAPALDLSARAAATRLNAELKFLLRAFGSEPMQQRTRRRILCLVCLRRR